MKKKIVLLAVKFFLVVFVFLTISEPLISTFAIEATELTADQAIDRSFVSGYRQELYARLSFSDGSLMHKPEKTQVILSVKTKNDWLGPLKIRARFRASICIFSCGELLEERFYETIYDDREEDSNAEIGPSRLEFPFTIVPEELQAPINTVQITGSFQIEELDDDDNVIAQGETSCFEMLSFGSPSEYFADVDQNSWYQNGVDFAVSNGLYRGVAENRFAPDETMTRGMLVTVLWRMSGTPSVEGTAGFEDVPRDAYYAKAVDWARMKLIVQGYSKEYFGPNDPVTREQLATIIYRYDNLWDNAAMVRFEESSRSTRTYAAQEYSKMIDLKPEYDTAEEQARRQRAVRNVELFDDKDQISNYAYNAVNWMVWTGIMQGMSSNRFEPKAFATRAQVAVVLQRLFVKDVFENYGYAIVMGPDPYIPLVK